MLDYDKMLTIAEMIKSDYPKEAKDFVDSFEWLSLSIDGVLATIGGQLQNIHQSGDFHKISELANLSIQLKEMQISVIDFSTHFKSQDAEDEELQEEELVDSESEEIEKKQLPNYAIYSIDCQTPHNLYEDYRFTKACGFALNGVIYEARNMRDVLVQTCSLLAMLDSEKIKMFVNDPSMQGSKVSYFGTASIVEDFVAKNEKIPGTDLYVWINLSCNYIRNILKKILKKYGIDYMKNFQIFLRADYSNLHKNDEEQRSAPNITLAREEKAGKHVASCMRRLSKCSYEFTANDLIAMQSEKWCKKQFGIHSALIKKYNPNEDITSQEAGNTYSRYQKEKFVFNGEKYLVTSQWNECRRTAFDQWFDALKEEKK